MLDRNSNSIHTRPMLLLALRQLQLDPMRSSLTALALSAALSVIIVLEGFESGLYAQLRHVVAARQTDLYVMQAGVANLIATRSNLPQLTRQDIEAISGVKAAHPLTAVAVIYDQGKRKSPVFLFVYDTLGGPVRLQEGRPASSGSEIVIDRSMASAYSLQLGDTVEIADYEFSLVGIAEEERALFTSFGFITYDGLIDFYLDSDIAADLSTFPLLSYLLVEVVDNANPREVALRIEEAVKHVDVYTTEQMMRNDVQLGRDLFGPILGLLTGVAYLIGLLVVGLILYADVNGRLNQYGVLKALGFGNGALVRLVWAQSTLLLLFALPVGWLWAEGTGQLIERFAPIYRVDTSELLALLRIGIAGFVFAVIGSVLPLHLITKLDPTLVFRNG